MFEQAFEKFLEEQRRSASGRRLERLEKDLTGEKKLLKEVLWPVLHSFDGMDLEYEIKSTSGMSIFVDVFYHPLGFAFESEGYVVHAENITRDRFSFERMRIRTLALYGYKYIPFSWDEQEQRPEACRRTFYELLGRFSGTDGNAFRELSVYEREVLRYALRLNRPLRLDDVRYCLQKGPGACIQVLRKLADKNLIMPLGRGTQRIHKYELGSRVAEYML